MPVEIGLIRAACGGDRDALGQVLFAQCGRLSNYIRRRLPSSIREVVSEDDILQQTLANAVRAIGGFEPRSERALSAWLNTIANRQIVDAVRAQKARKRGGGRPAVGKAGGGDRSSLVNLVELLSDHGASPSSVAARDEALRAVQVGIAELPTDQRKAVQCHLIEERSLHDTAVAMERTPDAVRSLIHRAKERLRTALGSRSRWMPGK